LEIPARLVYPFLHEDLIVAARDPLKKFERVFIFDVCLRRSWIAGRERETKLLRDGWYMDVRRRGSL
jgi:folate-dependent tRNA-U54 methylase TrmFO/GidA